MIPLAYCAQGAILRVLCRCARRIVRPRAVRPLSLLCAGDEVIKEWHGDEIQDPGMPSALGDVPRPFHGTSGIRQDIGTFLYPLPEERSWTDTDRVCPRLGHEHRRLPKAAHPLPSFAAFHLHYPGSTQPGADDSYGHRQLLPAARARLEGLPRQIAPRQHCPGGLVVRCV